MTPRSLPALLGFAFVATWAGLGLGVAIAALLVAAVCDLGGRMFRGELDPDELRERLDGAREGFSAPRRGRGA